MKLKKITFSLNGKTNLNAVMFCNSEYLDGVIKCFQQDELQTSSNVYLDTKKSLLIKLFNAHKGKEKLSLVKLAQNEFQKYTWTSAAVREFKGNALLARAGLNVPERIGVGYPTTFKKKYRAIYIQSFITKSITCHDFFMTNTDAKKRERILFLIAKDIDKLFKANIYYRDLNSKNIIVVNEEKIVWVDTIVRKKIIKGLLYKKIHKKSNTFIDRLVLYSNLSEVEKNFFLKNCRAASVVKGRI